MRVALTASLVSPIREAEANGPHSVIVDLARGLGARGHEVSVYAADGSAVRGVNVVQIPVEPEAADAALRADGSVDLRAQAALRRGFERMFDALRYAIPDVVSQHAFDAPAFELARGVPAVHTLHLPPIDPAVVRAARASSQTLVTVSFSAARAWSDAGITRLEVIRNGVPQLDDGQKSPLGAAQPFALICGRVSPEKGTDIGIRAARGAGLSARVVGEIYDGGYYEREVAPLLAPGEQITALPRQDLMRLMSTAAVTLVPSRWEETFGLVAAEAQMSGCPVVGFRRGALPEIVVEGISGYLVAPDDEDALVAAIQPARELDRTRIAVSARARLGLTPMVDRYEALLESVANRAAAA